VPCPEDKCRGFFSDNSSLNIRKLFCSYFFVCKKGFFGLWSLPVELLSGEVCPRLDPASSLALAWSSRALYADLVSNHRSNAHLGMSPTEGAFGPWFLDHCVANGHYELFHWALDNGCPCDADILLAVPSCPSYALVEELYNMIKERSPLFGFNSKKFALDKKLVEAVEFQMGKTCDKDYNSRCRSFNFDAENFIRGVLASGNDKAIMQICPLSLVETQPYKHYGLLISKYAREFDRLEIFLQFDSALSKVTLKAGLDVEFAYPGFSAGLYGNEVPRYFLENHLNSSPAGIFSNYIHFGANGSNNRWPQAILEFQPNFLYESYYFTRDVNICLQKVHAEFLSIVLKREEAVAYVLANFDASVRILFHKDQLSKNKSRNCFLVLMRACGGPEKVWKELITPETRNMIIMKTLELGDVEFLNLLVEESLMTVPEVLSVFLEYLSKRDCNAHPKLLFWLHLNGIELKKIPNSALHSLAVLKRVVDSAKSRKLQQILAILGTSFLSSLSSVIVNRFMNAYTTLTPRSFTLTSLSECIAIFFPYVGVSLGEKVVMKLKGVKKKPPSLQRFIDSLETRMNRFEANATSVPFTQANQSPFSKKEIAKLSMKADLKEY